MSILSQGGDKYRVRGTLTLSGLGDVIEFLIIGRFGLFCGAGNILGDRDEQLEEENHSANICGCSADTRNKKRYMVPCQRIWALVFSFARHPDRQWLEGPPISRSIHPIVGLQPYSHSIGTPMIKFVADLIARSGVGKMKSHHLSAD